MTTNPTRADWVVDEETGTVLQAPLPRPVGDGTYLRYRLHKGKWYVDKINKKVYDRITGQGKAGD